MASLEIIIFAIITIIGAVAALEAEKISRAIVALAISSGGVGSIFFFLGANYAAMYEFLVYGGVLIILFMIAASFTEKEPENSPKKEVKS